MKYTTYGLLTLNRRGWGQPVMVLQTLNPHTLEVEAAGRSLWVWGLPALYSDFWAGQWLIVRPGLKGKKKSHLNILIYSHLLLVTELCRSHHHCHPDPLTCKTEMSSTNCSTLASTIICFLSPKWNHKAFIFLWLALLTWQNVLKASQGWATSELPSFLEWNMPQAPSLLLKAPDARMSE